jgi:hypothetical protein
VSQLAIVAKNTLQSAKRHSPAILTGFAIAGVVSTVILTARATTRANQTIAANQYIGRDEPLTRVEKIKLVWTIYIPPSLTFLATIGCIIGAQSINVRRQAALVGAFTLTEGAFQEYKDQVAEALTKPAKEKLETAIAQKKVDENPPATELLMQADGKVLTSSRGDISAAQRRRSGWLRTTSTNASLLVGKIRCRSTSSTSSSGSNPASSARLSVSRRRIFSMSTSTRPRPREESHV